VKQVASSACSYFTCRLPNLRIRYALCPNGMTAIYWAAECMAVLGVLGQSLPVWLAALEPWRSV
jgi:hypothetical protein